ncbi:asparaginyl-tRNA synthetase [Natranaerovirga hydrolytica]|uniref:Asparagine--tRNA ligase n=1 Tax=Natranaerovirga hydrolytica TaxID=680378 RepID=A0A4R1MCY5_9FIRM|nr:asparagine--tRNA ligase [Natranaerovirga hydrolytica]TCK87889.1 asparaginyl-tRNA synthetase [Natranaerovirga hydrolytica]
MNQNVIIELYKNTNEYVGKEIKVSGWVRSIRNSKKFGFIVINDGTFFDNLQIVFDETLNNFEEITKLTVGSSITVQGKLIETPNMKQSFELQATFIKVEGQSTSDYPLQKKRHSFEYLRTIPHLRPRTNTFYAIFRIRSLISFAIHQFFIHKNFVYVHTPIITGSDCEGAGEMFRVTTLEPNKEHEGFLEDFFKKEANLTVSGQLNVEPYALAFRNVYTFGPTFRAENSNTTRHAAEFWMVEPEIAFAGLEENMALAEEMLKYIIHYVMDHAQEELEFCNQFIDKGLKERLDNVINSSFEKVTYTKAIELLQESQEIFEHKVQWGCDLQTEHERYLTEKVFKKPVFVTDYPKDIKAFYMRLNDDEKTVAAMDLLVPGIGEIIGGSQREERYDTLVKRMEESNLNQEDYWWYLDLRKYGGTQHAGFGLGLERAIMYITGMKNIRDVISYPRTVNHLEF